MTWALDPNSGFVGDVEVECFADPAWLVEDSQFHMTSVLTHAQEGQTWSELREGAQRRWEIYDITDPNQAEAAVLPVEGMAYGYQGGLASLGTALAVFGALLGATYVGADWRSGVIESQMVRVPNRARLIGGKFGAIALLTMIGSALTMGLYLATLIPSALWRGDFGAATGTFWVDVAAVVARASIAVAVMALIGGGLALIARNTVAGVVGVLLAFIGGGFLINTTGRWTPFAQLGENMRAFIGRGDVAYIYVQKLTDGGGESWDRVVSHGYLGAGLVLAAAMAAIVAASSASFVNRDVS